MKIKTITITIGLLTLLLTGHASPGEDGKTIFNSRCAGCHNVNKVVTGPALAGIDARRPIEWIIQFVHSSQAVVKSGDPYAVALFEKFNKIQMPDHPDISDENIKNIVGYIKSAAVSAPATPSATPTPVTGVNRPISMDNYGAILLYFGAVLLLIAALLAAVQVKELRKKRGLE